MCALDPAPHTQALRCPPGSDSALAVMNSYFAMSPLQPGWPHWHEISAMSLCDSQWVLQYFWSVMQEQAGWAHFFISAMKFLSPSGILNARSSGLDATLRRGFGSGWKDSATKWPRAIGSEIKGAEATDSG